MSGLSKHARPLGLVDGRYRLAAERRGGSLSDRHIAEDEQDGSRVAIDLLDPGLVADSAARARLARRLRALARLDHPAIVPTRRWSVSHRPPYVVRALVPGRPLADVMSRAPLQPAVVRLLLAPVAEALAYAHAKGVTHYDLRPETIVVDQAGDVLVDAFAPNRPPLAPPSAYWAPEQVAGGHITRACDVYALGCLLFVLACGEPPFLDDRSGYRERVRINAPSLAALAPELDTTDPDLVALCRALLARAPEKRPSAREAVGRLRAGLPSQRAAAPRSDRRTDEPESASARVGLTLVAGLVVAATLIAIAGRTTAGSPRLPRIGDAALSAVTVKGQGLVPLSSASCSLAVPRGWTAASLDLDRGAVWHNEVRGGDLAAIGCDVPRQRGAPSPRAAAIGASSAGAGLHGYRELALGPARVAGRRAYEWRYRELAGSVPVEVRRVFFADGVSLEARMPAASVRGLGPLVAAALASYGGRLVRPGQAPHTASVRRRVWPPSGTALAGAPVLAWPALAGTRSYSVAVQAGPRTIVTARPSAPRVRLPAGELVAGRAYTWDVRPVFRQDGGLRTGPVIGHAAFRYLGAASS